MAVILEGDKTTYLYDTPVENIFIGEYMADAPGDYVKVYLVGLMASKMEKGMDDEDIAKTLQMKLDDVKKAFKYFEMQGIIKNIGDDHIYLKIKEKLYGRQEEVKHETPSVASQEAYSRLLNNQPIAEMMDRIQQLTGRYSDPGDQKAIQEWLGDFGILPEVIVKVYEYSVERGADNHRYRQKVMSSWMSQGLKTREDVEEFLDMNDERHYQYRRVMKALGFSRNPSEGEMKMMDAWFDDCGFTIEEVLEGCEKTTGISNPNLNYIDAVLRNKKSAQPKSTSHRSVKEYYEYLREQAEKDAAGRKREVYEKVPRIGEIAEELKDANREMTMTLVAGDSGKLEKMDELKALISRLGDEKTRLMTEYNIPIDYMNVRYRCNRCQDTGVTEEGTRCQCYLERVKEAEKWVENSNF